MTQELKIQHIRDGERGRYWAALDEGYEAEMTYRKTADGPMVIDHTFVPPRFEGRGIALKLVKAAVADARAEGIRISPVCPYVAVQFRRHPDWGDLLA